MTRVAVRKGECPLGVNRVTLTVCWSLPIFPNKRTVFGGSRHVSKVPQADSCAAANSASIQLVRRLVARYRALLHVSKDVLWTGAQHCFLGLGMMT
jgi:hypothetical protein